MGFSNLENNKINSKDNITQLNINPKFLRSEEEEELATEFFIEHQYEIKKYEDSLYAAVGDVYKGDKEEQIYNCNKAIEIWNQYRNWCYKTKAGTIHFQDMWEYCHNSRNPCFSYIDEVEKHLYNLENGINEECTFFGVPVELGNKLEELIKNSENILQKDIYDILKTDKKQELRNYISYLESENRIKRTKIGNTYELKWNFDEK